LTILFCSVTLTQIIRIGEIKFSKVTFFFIEKIPSEINSGLRERIATNRERFLMAL